MDVDLLNRCVFDCPAVAPTNDSRYRHRREGQLLGVRGQETAMVLSKRPTPDIETEEYLVGKRILAFFIDAIVAGALAAAPALIAGIPDAIVSGPATAIFLFYFIHLEAIYGQTVGKKITGIVVVTEGGDAIGYSASLIRTLLRVIDALPVFYIVGGIAIFLTERRQRIGDLAASTVVVRTEENT